MTPEQARRVGQILRPYLPLIREKRLERARAAQAHAEREGVVPPDRPE
jgi:hypothetical protein